MNSSPELYTLYYHITSKCNLKCKHCWVDAKKTHIDELSLNEAKNIMLQAIPLGLRNVKITGGEPFIVPWLMDIVKFLRDRDISVAFETNGTLISPDIANQLAKLKVEDIAVSIDGSNARVHEAIRCVKGCFTAAIEGVKNLHDAGIPTQILAAVDKSNLEDVPAITALADSLGANSIKFNVITPTGRAQVLDDNKMLLSFEEKTHLFYSIRELEKNVSLGIQMAFLPLLCPSSKMTKGMCMSCNVLHMLGILSDGRISMCGIGNTHDQLIYGNIRKTSLETIWRTNPHSVLLELRAGLPEKLTGICSRCIFRKYCQGGCRAVAYARYRSVMAPEPTCQDAWETGAVSLERLIEDNTVMDAVK